MGVNSRSFRTAGEWGIIERDKKRKGVIGDRETYALTQFGAPSNCFNPFCGEDKTALNSQRHYSLRLVIWFHLGFNIPPGPYQGVLQSAFRFSAGTFATSKQTNTPNEFELYGWLLVRALLRHCTRRNFTLRCFACTASVGASSTFRLYIRRFTTVNFTPFFFPSLVLPFLRGTRANETRRDTSNGIKCIWAVRASRDFSIRISIRTAT